MPSDGCGGGEGSFTLYTLWVHSGIDLASEEEMRRIDPDAYPESERPPDPLQQEATLSAALEAQAAAARAAQGGLPDDNA